MSFDYNVLLYRLVDASRKLDVTDQASTLRIISDHLRRLGSVQLAVDILRRLGDTTALAAALVECGAWTEALTLAKQFPDLSRNVYLPYARWLAEQEQFIEAQQGENCFIYSRKMEGFI
jgi:intraflagellar transport protein 122